MAYTINRYNGQQLTEVIDATINNSTDLKLVGRNFAGYGEVQNENFVYLLENFSGETEPSNKIRGQLWFDTDSSKLKLYTGSRWKELGFVQNSDTEPVQVAGDIWNDSSAHKLKFYDGNSYRTIAVTQNQTAQPDNLVEGDFWWNTDSKQLFAYNGSDFDLIGPARAGEQPTLMISELVKDTANQDQAIIRAVVDGQSVFVVSENEFEISTDTPVTGFSDVKKGITLVDSETGITQDNNTWFWGTAADAARLDGIQSEQFLRSDINANHDANINFTTNNTGIEWQDNSAIKQNNGFLQFSVDDNSAFEFSYKSGSNDVELLKISTEQGIDGLTFRGGLVWHSDNDGPGTGLNADLLDGFEAADFLSSNGKAADSEKLDGLDSSEFLLKTGGTMSGNIGFTDDSEGIEWNRDTDGASIKFYSASDSDPDTRLEFQTRDNTNEYFLWTHKSTGNNPDIELMRLVPNDSTNGLTFRQNTVWHEGNQGSDSGLDADTVDGKHATAFLLKNETADFARNADKVDGFDANEFMKITGGTFTGLVTLASEPTQSRHAATKKYVDDQIDDFGVTGQVSYFAMTSPPQGWLKANGAAVSRTTYSKLFDEIGTRFGNGNGSTTFNLPDLRGEFIRGWDDSRGVDSGRNFGSFQSDELKQHRHPLVGNDRGTIGSQKFAPGLFKDDAERTASDSNSIGFAGGNETRPRNIALLACIKF